MRTAKRVVIVVAAAAFGPAMGLVGAAGALVACNQDSYASVPERDTHMGDTRAAPEPSGTAGASPVASAAVSPPPAPGASAAVHALHAAPASAPSSKTAP